MSLFEECFGDLSKESQEQLREQLNKINRVVGLREIKQEEITEK